MMAGGRHTPIDRLERNRKVLTFTFDDAFIAKLNQRVVWFQGGLPNVTKITRLFLNLEINA